MIRELAEFIGVIDSGTPTTIYTGLLKTYDTFGYSVEGGFAWYVNGVALGPGTSGAKGSISSIGGATCGYESYIGPDVADAVVTVLATTGAPYGGFWVLRGTGGVLVDDIGSNHGGDINNVFDSENMPVPTPDCPDKCAYSITLINEFPVACDVRPGSWVFNWASGADTACCENSVGSAPLGTFITLADGQLTLGVAKNVDSYTLDMSITGAGDTNGSGNAVVLWPTNPSSTLGIEVDGNTITDISGNALEIRQIDNVYVRDNAISYTDLTAIILSGVRRGAISDNSLLQVGLAGMQVGSCEGIIISDNLVMDASQTVSGAHPAINLSGVCRSNYVTGNTIHRSGSVDALVSYGVAVADGCIDNTIAFNDMVGGTATGATDVADTLVNTVVDNLPDIGGGALDPIGNHDHTSAVGDGGVLTDDEHDGYTQHSALVSDPAVPATGKVKLYAKTDSGVTSYFMRTDSGAIVKLGSGGGASLIPAHYDFQPEFPNAIFVPATIDNGTLVPHDDSTARYNAYDWTTDQVSDQTIQIILRWRLSPRFSAWTGPLKVISKVSNSVGTSAVELMEFLDGSGTNVITPSSQQNAAWTEDSWTITGGTFAAGDIVTLRFKLHAANDEHAYLGPIQLAFNEE